MRHTTAGARPLDVETVIQAQRISQRDIERDLRAAGREQAARTRSLIHSRSGALAAATTSSVRRTGLGYVLRIGPIKKGTMVVRRAGSATRQEKYDLFYKYFVERGTGSRGPLGRPIPKERRGLIPDGGGLREPSGVGMAAQHPFGRARDLYDSVIAPVVDRRIQDRQDRAIERALRGGR